MPGILLFSLCISSSHSELSRTAALLSPENLLEMQYRADRHINQKL